MTTRGAYGQNQAPSCRTIGERIKAIRKKWNWTQARLALAIGSDQRTLSSWETGRYEVPGPALTLLAALFQVPVEVLTGEEPFRPTLPPADGAAEQKNPYLALPAQPTPGVWLVDRTTGERFEIKPAETQRLVREARKAGRPVWLVLG
jgi:DNA-binding transcriptional regulator YiaG